MNEMPSAYVFAVAGDAPFVDAIRKVAAALVPRDAPQLG